MISPTGNNPLDDFFANYSKDSAAADKPGNTPKSENRGLDAASWLNQQTRTLLDTPQRVENFLISFFTEENKLPNVDEITKIINDELTTGSEKHFKVNSKSESFQTVLPKIYDAVKRHPLKQVSYYSKDAILNNKNNIVIFIEDHDHRSGEHTTQNYQLIKDLYKNPELHLSDSFSEGPIDPGEEIKQLPPGVPEKNFLVGMQQGQVTPIHTLTYLAQSWNKDQFPNLEFANFNPEKMKISDSLDITVTALLSAASGLLTHGLRSEDKPGLENGLVHTLETFKQIENIFEKTNSKNKFYALLGSRIKANLNDLGLSQTQQLSLIRNFQRLTETTSNTFMSTMNQLPAVMQVADSQRFISGLRSKNNTKTVLERNKSLAERIANQNGTKVLIFGSGHTDFTQYGESSMQKLLEAKGIPVIIIS